MPLHLPRFLRLTWVLIFWGSFHLARLHSDEPIAGLGPTGEIVKVAGDFQFTEGPAFDGKRFLYFTDIPANRIYRFDTLEARKAPEVFLEPAGTCNGLMFDRQGRLIACRMEGEIVAIDVDTKKVTSLVSQYDGKRFNACNDLVIDKTGGIYFTDPRFRAPEPWPQGKEAVYYLSPQGDITRLSDDLIAPNGILMSPDETKLYVIPSMESKMYVYDVKAPGKIGNRKVFCELAQPAKQSGKGGDGLTMDAQGNLYITSALGLQVFSPAGRKLGIIALPEQPANVTFGGADNMTIFATARTGLYAIPMSVKGHR